MLFSSMIFLWLFLPIVFCLYYLVKEEYRNYVLLISSIIFYFWGEPLLILVMLFSSIVNFLLGILMSKGIKRRLMLVFGIIFNVMLLGYFKYFSSILLGIEKIFNMKIFNIGTIVLPLGISFYTFQGMSYIIDLYRGDIKCQKNILKFVLYIGFFPQLIAGPIVKYKDIEKQISYRVNSQDRIASGIRRFIYGLGKKVIISNTIASSVDKIFSISIEELGSLWVWGGVILYTLQIYYDFSGYSDMAIGLGKMFGFEFKENFNYPYISKSIKEFWRRWHISLSTWFREYVYIPLGGNRKGNLNTYMNLWIVFIITGVWHGASLNFLLWGIWHGLFIFIERLGFGKILEKNKIKIINHIYTLLIVAIGWAIFRCNSLEEAMSMLSVIMNFKSGKGTVSWYDILSTRVIIISIFAVLVSGPLQSIWHNMRKKTLSSKRICAIELGIQTCIMLIVFIMLISGQYNPFIYFKF